MKTCALFALLVLFTLCIPSITSAQEKADYLQSQMPSVVTVPKEALWSDHFDPEAATNAYLAHLTGQ
jgi:hypothetical protein